MTRFSVGMSLSLAFAAGCLNVPTIETIVPQYGFVDGCTDVVLQGHHIGTEATVELRNDTHSVALDLTPAAFDDTKPEHAQDIGFLYTATTPTGELVQGDGGFFDVVLTLDGAESMIADGWYFRDCPGTVGVEGEAFADPLVGGSEVFLAGCGLDAAAVTATVYEFDGKSTCAPVKDGADIALTAACDTAEATLALPAGLADDTTYTLALTDGDGMEFDFGSPADLKNKDVKARHCQGLSFTTAKGAP